MFHYSKYWGTWSRILQTVDIGYKVYTEVNLTPVNGAWDEVRPIIIRVHSTAPKEGEIRHHLPLQVQELMYRHIGSALTHRLMSDDLLSEMDLDRLKLLMRGGGVPISDVVKRVAC